jgi:Ulp1 family protease
MLVLRLLADQMTLLLETGKMDQRKFGDGLRGEGLPVPAAGSSTAGYSEPDAFHEHVRNSTDADMLLVKGANFRFGIESLRRLGATRWLNDEIILACLHLSDKLSLVRVGFSIPIHRQTQAHSIMPRPFETAARQIATWHNQTEAWSHLVCFFPLLQHQNHFSLLEINEREGSIYHYDSMGKGENTHIKVCMRYLIRGRVLISWQVACEKEFPQLQYVEMVRPLPRQIG